METLAINSQIEILGSTYTVSKIFKSGTVILKGAKGAEYTLTAYRDLNGYQYINGCLVYNIRTYNTCKYFIFSNNTTLPCHAA